MGKVAFTLVNKITGKKVFFYDWKLVDEDFIKKYHGEHFLLCGCKGNKDDTTLVKLNQRKSKYYLSPHLKSAHHVNCSWYGEVIPSVEDKDGLKMVKVASKKEVESTKIKSIGEKNRVYKKRRECKTHNGALTYILLLAWEKFNLFKTKKSFNSFIWAYLYNYSMSGLRYDGKCISISEAIDKKLYCLGVIESVKENGYNSKVSLNLMGRRSNITVRTEAFKMARKQYNNITNGKFLLAGFQAKSSFINKADKKKVEYTYYRNLALIRIAENEHIPVDSINEAQITDMLIERNIKFMKPYESVGSFYNNWIPDFIILQDNLKIIVECFGLKDFEYTIKKEKKIQIGNTINEKIKGFAFTHINKPEEKDNKVLLDRVLKLAKERR